MSHDHRRNPRLALSLGVWFLGTLIVSAGAGLALARATTDSPRPYAVLDPTAVVHLGGADRTVDELAQLHRPAIAVHPDLAPDPVTGISYEAVRAGEDLILRYFVSWVDEYHPNPVADAFYRSYRSAYYGGTRDIEYVQLRLDPSGQVAEVRFETSGALDPHTSRPVHVDAVARREGTDLVRTVLAPVEEGISRTLRVPAGEQVRLCVVSWNHLLDLAPDDARCQDPTDVDSPLATPLTDADYQHSAAARRGHPDPANVQTPGRELAGRVGTGLFLGAPVLAVILTGLRLLRRRR